MKVLLLRDIPKLGKKGEERQVSDGYARNYLLRQNLAVQTGTSASKKALQEFQDRARLKERAKKEQVHLINKITGLTLEMAHPANDQGNLFSAISPQEIAQNLEKTLRVTINPDRIEIAEPIKSKGQHKACYKLESNRAEFKVNVKPIAK